MAIFEVRVVAGLDDAEERASGSVNTTSSDLELTFDGSTQQAVGIRFTSVDIPHGATITSAYIQFTVDQVSRGIIAAIRGEDPNDANAFAAVNFNVFSRPVTDASVAWAPADWTIRGEAAPRSARATSPRSCRRSSTARVGRLSTTWPSLLPAPAPAQRGPLKAELRPRRCCASNTIRPAWPAIRWSSTSAGQ